MEIGLSTQISLIMIPIWLGVIYYAIWSWRKFDRDWHWKKDFAQRNKQSVSN